MGYRARNQANEEEEDLTSVEEGPMLPENLKNSSLKEKHRELLQKKACEELGGGTGTSLGEGPNRHGQKLVGT